MNGKMMKQVQSLKRRAKRKENQEKAQEEVAMPTKNILKAFSSE